MGPAEYPDFDIQLIIVVWSKRRLPLAQTAAAPRGTPDQHQRA